MGNKSTSATSDLSDASKCCCCSAHSPPPPPRSAVTAWGADELDRGGASATHTAADSPSTLGNITTPNSATQKQGPKHKTESLDQNNCLAAEKHCPGSLGNREGKATVDKWADSCVHRSENWHWVRNRAAAVGIKIEVRKAKVRGLGEVFLSRDLEGEGSRKR